MSIEIRVKGSLSTESQSEVVPLATPRDEFGSPRIEVLKWGKPPLLAPSVPAQPQEPLNPNPVLDKEAEKMIPELLAFVDSLKKPNSK